MEEDIKIYKDKINFLNEKYADEHGEDYFPVLAITTTFNARTILAFEDVLRRLEQDERVIDKLEEKLMYALSPTNSELAIVTKQNFKKIIRENIDQDTYTIKRELKKYWKDEVDYFRKKCE